MDAWGHHFWDGFGSLGDTTWEMEKAGFGEARLTGARQQPVGFEAQLGVPFWMAWGIRDGFGNPLGITFGIGFGSLGDTTGKWKKQVSAKPG